MVKRKTTKVCFWIRSNRGTDESQVVAVPRAISDADLTLRLERWCGQFGAWGHGDNTVQYGWRPAKTRR